VGRSGKIVKTTNGGGSWTYLTSGTSINLRSVFFTNANNGYAVGESGIILRTNDAGLTWNSYNNLSFFNQLNDVSFPSSCVGYAVGNSGRIMKTSTSGNSWTLINSGTTKGLQSVFFTDDNTGYVVGDSAKIFKTSDGGTTWQAQTSGIFTTLSAVYFTNTDTGYAVGVGGKILKTFDGGTTWNLLNSGVTENLTSVYFVNRDLGFAVGASGRLVKTTDAGLTWQIKYTATTLDLKSVYFPSASVGYMSAVSGHIRKSVDGGNTWTQQTNNINYVITSLAFADDNRGYAVGYDYNHNGLIYTTSNGGTNWSVETIPPDHDLRSVTFVDSITAVIVGNNGTILKNGSGSSLITTTNLSICEGTALALTSAQSGIAYSWTGPNAFTSSQTTALVSNQASANMSGAYTLDIALTGCSNAIEITNVTVEPIPTVPTASNNGPVYEDSLLTLSADSIAGASYAWSGPNGFSSNLQNPVVSTNASLLMAGNYELTVTVNGCSSAVSSTTVVVNTTVGVSVKAKSAAFTFSPNPVKEQLYVSTDSKKQAQLFFYNQLGECVKQHTVREGQQSIDLSSLATGMYVIRFVDGEHTAQEVFIKE
jgi:photosystem II stability/assembly factor-like uncharacterized protein